MPKKTEQSGFAHILILLIVLVGLAAGIYLVLNQVIFNPHASGQKPNLVVPPPLATPAQSTTSTEQYVNPFDSSSSAQYSNPFDPSSQNPFNNLQ